MLIMCLLICYCCVAAELVAAGGANLWQKNAFTNEDVGTNHVTYVVESMLRQVHDVNREFSEWYHLIVVVEQLVENTDVLFLIHTVFPGKRMLNIFDALTNAYVCI